MVHLLQNAKDWDTETCGFYSSNPYIDPICKRHTIRKAYLHTNTELYEMNE